jgi:hypothetical protein
MLRRLSQCCCSAFTQRCAYTINITKPKPLAKTKRIGRKPKGSRSKDVKSTYRDDVQVASRSTALIEASRSSGADLIDEFRSQFCEQVPSRHWALFAIHEVMGSNKVLPGSKGQYVFIRAEEYDRRFFREVKHAGTLRKGLANCDSSAKEMRVVGERKGHAAKGTLVVTIARNSVTADKALLALRDDEGNPLLITRVLKGSSIMGLMGNLAEAIRKSQL